MSLIAVPLSVLIAAISVFFTASVGLMGLIWRAGTIESRIMTTLKDIDKRLERLENLRDKEWPTYSPFRNRPGG